MWNYVDRGKMRMIIGAIQFVWLAFKVLKIRLDSKIILNKMFFGLSKFHLAMSNLF